jgi:hypothetical protein
MACSRSQPKEALFDKLLRLLFRTAKKIDECLEIIKASVEPEETK